MRKHFFFTLRIGGLIAVLMAGMSIQAVPPRNLGEETFLGQSLDTLPPLRLNSVSCDSNAAHDITYSTTHIATQERSVERSAWTWQLFPEGLIYPAYLANVNDSRMGGVWNYDKDLGWDWDINLGGRASMLRYGTKSTLYPEGFQVDFEGNVHLRLDLENEMDMDANDFHFGIPFSYGTKIWQVRTGYYHVSSHMGDERILRRQNQGLPHERLNYVREAWILGYSCKVTQSLKVYAEADYAFWTGEKTKPWHFLFGAEYSKPYPARDWWGTPFAAVNVLLLQEHDFDGNITVQTGWQWRGQRNQLFRFGVQYFAGISEQYEHIDKREHQIGLGFWYDF
jgi:hypothetical protein